MLRRLLPLLIGAMVILAPASAGAAEESERTFLADAMVNGASGWAQNYQGVYWTDDGGASWRNITPTAGGRPVFPQAVDFADPEHGWAAAEEGDEPHPRAALFATSNGGRSWKRTPIRLPVRYAQVGNASFAAVGVHHVVALVRVSHDTSLSVGYLYVSNDGGRHWHRLPVQPPHAGEIAFTSAKDGWLAEEGPQPALYRTRDGGRSWQEVNLPRPPGLADASTDYLAPKFEADGDGVLAATYDNYEQRAVTVLYSTADFGRHWKIAASTRLLVKGDPVVFAYRGDLVVTAIYEAPRLGLLGADGSTFPLAGAGLPTDRSPWLSFSGDEDGFGRINGEECDVTAKRSNCTEVNGLYFTSDGGETWTPATLP
jgi:photosystem II stability/assembly factor-like uncharacterized protein